jgi:1-acyl-sn-glycerol-3-phosphate acyltransferase
MNVSADEVVRAVPSFTRPQRAKCPPPAARVRPGWQRHPGRVLLRLAGLAGTLGLTALDFFLTVRLLGRTESIHARARWMQRTARRLARALHIEVTVRGQPPGRGLLVSNHLGYTDLIVLGSAQPFVFVAKSEIRNWPLIGRITQAMGTIFIRRDRPSDVHRVVGQFPALLARRMVVAFFPEGTCTDGSTILPFHSSLFAPAVRGGYPVTAAAIRYALEDGAAEDEVCFWNDVPFGLHLLNLLSKRRIYARVNFGPPLPPGPDRKHLARESRRRVGELSELINARPSVASRSAIRKRKLLSLTQLPNLISALRLVGAPFLLGFSMATGSRAEFLGWFWALVATDAADGFLARRLHAESNFGRSLDSWADYATLGATAVGLAILWPEVVRSEGGWLLAGVAGLFFAPVYGLVRWRKLPAYHTWLAKGLGVAFPFALACRLADGWAAPLHGVIVAQLLGAVEELMIALLLPGRPGKVSTVWHAWQLRREENETEFVGAR